MNWQEQYFQFELVFGLLSKRYFFLFNSDTQENPRTLIFVVPDYQYVRITGFAIPHALGRLRPIIMVRLCTCIVPLANSDLRFQFYSMGLCYFEASQSFCLSRIKIVHSLYLSSMPSWRLGQKSKKKKLLILFSENILIKKSKNFVDLDFFFFFFAIEQKARLKYVICCCIRMSGDHTVDIKHLFFVVNEVLALNCVLYGSCTNLKISRQVSHNFLETKQVINV